MPERRYFEHYTADNPPQLDRWYCCNCCGYPTLGLPKNYEICELCSWMEDYSGGDGPRPETLPEARENFRRDLTKYRPGSNGFKAHD